MVRIKKYFRKLKSILEKIIKAILTISTLIGMVSLIIFFRFHLYHYPILIKFLQYEIFLLLAMVVLFLLIIKFEIKYLKLIVIVGIILAGINLFGFDILLNITYKYTCHFPSHSVSISPKYRLQK